MLMKQDEKGEKQKMGRKKETNILLGFDLTVPRQKKAYEVLVNEKSEKGIPYKYIVHEALELYGQYARTKESSAGNILARSKKSENYQKKEQTPETRETKQILTDEDIEDPYYAG